MKVTDGVKLTYNLAPPFSHGFMTMGKDRPGTQGEHTASEVGVQEGTELSQCYGLTTARVNIEC